MQIHELVDLGKFLRDVIERQALAQRYKQLISAVSRASQNQSPQDVLIELEQLRKIHEEIDKELLGSAQSKLLSDYGADEILGRRAIERLDEIFREHGANPQGLNAALEKLRSETNE